MKRRLLFALAIAATPLQATFASDKVSFGKIGLAGNGCPEETESTLQTLVKLDDTSVRVIPLQFVLSNKLSERNFVRQKCDMAIAVKVIDGYQVGISNASVESFVVLDDQSKSTVQLDTGFTGGKFEKKESKFESLTHQSAALTNDTTQWSKCGADTIIRMKVSATLRAAKTGLSYLRVNSFGMGFEYRACS